MEVFIEFYNNLSNIELVILWSIVFTFIILIGISSSLYLKNKELKCLLKNKKDIIVDTKEEIKTVNREVKKQVFVKDEMDIDLNKIERKDNIYSKNVFKDASLRYQTSPINIVGEKKEAKPNNISYTEELTKKLEEELKPQTIELTEYEKEQEDAAIISYKELLSNNKDKVYNINDEDDTTDFIKELKSFRKSL